MLQITFIESADVLDVVTLRWTQAETDLDAAHETGDQFIIQATERAVAAAHAEYIAAMEMLTDSENAR